MEQAKVLAAALALRNFTIDEVSGLSGVNPRTVRSVLRRNAPLIRRADLERLSRHADDEARRGRGRPASRWLVADGDEIRRLVEEAVAVPSFTPDYMNLDSEDWRSVAVSVAEDAMIQVTDESDPELMERLVSSARTSLFFAGADSPPSAGPWWETDDSSLALRAKGVDAIAALVNPAATAGGPGAATLLLTTNILADAMQASPRGDAAYFAPFSKVLAYSGRFAPVYAVCGPEVQDVYPLHDEWTEVALPDFHTQVGRVVTQVWAKPLTNVSSSMPVVVSSRNQAPFVNEMIDGIKSVPRPAVVFGSVDDGGLIRKSGRAGASFVPVGGPLAYDRQNAIDSVVAVIDRFTAR